MVATRIGGIQDQISHGDSGLMPDEASHPAGFGRAVQRLAPRRLAQELDLIERVAG